MNVSQRISSLKALGPAITPAMLQGTMALYASRAPRPEPQFVTVTRDIRYGDDPRHRLDIFRPVAANGAGTVTLAPALVFVHGGGFIGGDKGNAEAPFYNNIGTWAAASGLIGVTMTYRLAPNSPWPAGRDDVALAVKWLRTHATEHGIDERRIIVMGQSAGAAHVASYVAQHTESTDVAGAIFLSGLYDLTRLAHSPMEKAYFGEDESTFAERSALAGLMTTRVPCLYSVAELDPEVFQKQAALVVEAHVAAHGRWPRMQYLSGHNHLSPALAIGGADDDIGPALLSFVEGLDPAPRA